MQFDSKAFRNTLGNFATGVCIVTTHDHNAAPIGMTINSFSSLSLDPPLVSWSIQHGSECFQSFHNAESFTINILAADQQELAQTYSRKGQHTLKGAHFFQGHAGAPVLHGALAIFECRLWASYPGGDHLILIGEVLNFVAQPMARALGFFKGAYTEIY